MNNSAFGAAKKPFSDPNIPSVNFVTSDRRPPVLTVTTPIPDQLIVLGDGTTLRTGPRTVSNADWPPLASIAGGSQTEFARVTSFSTDITATTGNFLTGALGFSTNATLTSFSANNLVYIGGNLFGASNNVNALTSFNFPELVAVGGTVNASGFNATLTTAYFPKLRFVGGGAGFPAPGVTVNPFPALEQVNGSLSVTSFGAALTTLEFVHLRIAGSITIGAGNSITTLSTPKLEAIVLTTAIQLTGASLTTWSMPPTGVFKYCSAGFTVTSPLNVATVDGILARLAYMDGNNNTTLYGSGRTVSLTGSCAAPTNAGSTTTAGSNFVCAGTTCTVNWTGHGYANNDVLRISGITTATNANRYAVINVVSANQFTYTITSQTATGAGTATVIKAGNDVKTLVARGVSLTTN